MLKRIIKGLRPKRPKPILKKKKRTFVDCSHYRCFSWPLLVSYTGAVRYQINRTKDPKSKSTTLLDQNPAYATVLDGNPSS